MRLTSIIFTLLLFEVVFASNKTKCDGLILKKKNSFFFNILDCKSSYMKKGTLQITGTDKNILNKYSNSKHIVRSSVNFMKCKNSFCAQLNNIKRGRIRAENL